MSVGFDFIYGLNKNIILEEDVPPLMAEPVKKVKKAIDIIPKKVRKNSYGHIALNLFKSLYPDKFASKERAAEKFEQLRTKIRNRLKQYVDLSKRLDMKKYLPEQYEEYKRVAAEKGVPFLLSKPLLKDEEVDRLLKDGYASVVLSVIPEKQIQEMMMDPDNEVGQILLKKINLGAKLLGKEGYELTGWDDDLFTGIKVVDDKGIEHSLIQGGESTPSATPEASPAQTKTPEVKPEIRAEKPRGNEEDIKRLLTPAKKAEGQPRRIEDLRGSSLVNSENRQIISSFMKKMVDYVFLDRDQHGNLLKKLSKEELALMKPEDRAKLPRRMYDELMYDLKNDATPIEGIFKSLIKIVTEGIAHKLAIIAVRGLVEYDIYMYDKPDASPLLKQAYLNRFFKKFENQIALTGLSFYPDTIARLKKEWIKFADEALTTSGFDDSVDELATYSKAILDRKIDEESLPHMKEAITSTSQSIRDTLDKDPQFIQGMSDVLLDKELIRSIFKDADPDLREKISKIEKTEKGKVIDTSFEKRMEKIREMRAKDAQRKKEEKDKVDDEAMGLSPQQVTLRKELREKMRQKMSQKIASMPTFKQFAGSSKEEEL